VEAINGDETHQDGSSSEHTVIYRCDFEQALAPMAEGTERLAAIWQILRFSGLSLKNRHFVT